MVLSSIVGSKRPTLWNFEMKIDRDDFCVTLFSNASTAIYTLNSQTRFTNSLALPVDLGSTSEWEVGLCEMSYAPPKRMVVQGALYDLVGDVNFLVHCDLVTPQLIGSDLLRVLRTSIAPSPTGQHLFSTLLPSCDNHFHYAYNYWHYIRWLHSPRVVFGRWQNDTYETSITLPMHTMGKGTGGDYPLSNVSNW